VVDAMAALAVLLDEMSTAQQAEMLGDGWTGNGKGLGDATGGLASLAQQVEHGTAGGVGQRAESSLDGICNRTVTHNM